MIEDETDYVEERPNPEPDSATNHLFSHSCLIEEQSTLEPSSVGDKIVMVDSINHALSEELELNDREIKLVGSQSHYDEERKRWYVLFLFETTEPLTEEEMKNPCEGIDELLYLDLEEANSENSTQGLKDIREAMKVPGKTYI